MSGEYAHLNSLFAVRVVLIALNMFSVIKIGNAAMKSGGTVSWEIDSFELRQRNERLRTQLLTRLWALCNL